MMGGGGQEAKNALINCTESVLPYPCRQINLWQSQERILVFHADFSYYLAAKRNIVICNSARFQPLIG